MSDKVLIDGETLNGVDPSSFINSMVIGLSPAVSLGSNMLSLASALSTSYVNAANQQQLNYMTAAAAAAQNIGARGRSSPAASEALDLLKRVVATLQAN